jgi:signal transduction histidine kinase
LGPQNILNFIFKEEPINTLSKDYVMKLSKETKWVDQQVKINPKLLRELKQKKSWLQVLDENGTEIYQVDRPASIPRHYIPGQLVSYQQFPKETGYLISTWYAKVNGRHLTWVVGRIGDPDTKSTQPLKVQFYFLTSMLLGWLVITILVALFYGKQLGSPLLHMLTWLKGLAEGLYDEPTDQEGRPYSKNRAGTLKRSYRVYQEVIESLEKLALTLKRNEEERKKLEQTREEWMTGISHDLKTPLSSIKGYIDILAASKYNISKQEMERITGILQERIAYVEDLIEDFNLTFHLKNDTLPLNRERVNVVELVEESVLDLANSPQAVHYDLSFSSDQDVIEVKLDSKWFRRALDNLIGNALIHNPPGTKVEVSVGKERESLVLITIKDNGIGMDEETQSRLFERYFRGTDSSHAYKGTGLGMAIAYQLIQEHGGTIILHSHLGEGTEIQIRLEG